MDKKLDRRIMNPYTGFLGPSHVFDDTGFVAHDLYLEEIKSLHASYMTALDDQREMMGRIIRLTKEVATLKELISDKETS